jgi:hypothetical protein
MSKPNRHIAKTDDQTGNPINGQSRCGGIGVWTTTSNEQVSCPLCARIIGSTEAKE